jgi:hypothetical protein
MAERVEKTGGRALEWKWSRVLFERVWNLGSGRKVEMEGAGEGS